MAEFAVGPKMQKIIDTCSDVLVNDYLKDYIKYYLKDQYRWQTGMKEELERLRENQPKIQAVVFAANQAQINSDENPGLNKWIWQLRDALDEADDVLDELAYMKHKEQLATKNTEETKKRKVTSFLCESARKAFKICKRVFKIDPNLIRLEKAVEELDKVSADVINFLHLLESAKQEQKEQEIDFYKARETGSLPTTNDLIGRDEAKDYVTQWLKKLSNEHRDRNNISLLSIVGHGGMGKTTLLQHVYKDKEISKEFNLKIWVCVSNNFDVKKVIADMLSSLKKERPRLDDTLDAHQNCLKNVVMSKRFLLVLDDIWEEDEEKDKSKWLNVLASLASGGFGSKILITTRTDSVAQMFAKVIQRKKEIVKLEGLEEDKCLQLLISHALAGVENPPDGHEKLRAIAGKIVKKLLGSPLAAKVIGGVLSSKLDERHWRTVLENNLLGNHSIHSILRLSYIVLPNPLRNCFEFCCTFAQDHQYDKDDLIRMWIALGFIQPTLDQEETMEEIGEKYFDVLVKKTLLEKVGDDYKMHDLIHESASTFFAQECGKFVGDEESSFNISETIRYLSVETANPNILKKIVQFKYLRSLFLTFYEGSNEQDLCKLLIEIFKASRRLRLLYIWALEDLEKISKEIENLIHLRYLKIEVDNLTKLPSSVSNLYHLQYIIYEGPLRQSEGDDFLPSDMNNLSNLRYMKLPKDCISSIRGIGKLKSLQKLNEYNLRDVSGFRIGELENMNDLCKLGINCLENVKDAEEACSAKLCAKRRLTDLALCWSDTYSTENECLNDLDENVLDNLQPPKCLRNLRIEGYIGARSPIWMNNVNPISNLEKIELTYCWCWETLPPFGKLRFLKSLKLCCMSEITWLFDGNDKYDAFPLLKVLHISYLEALEDWFEAGVAAEDGFLFPSLIELKIDHCPNLKELPSLPSKLKSLKISMGWKTLNFCSISNYISLETLAVFNCPNITSLPLADEIARLAALRHLTITKCPNLISLGRYPEVETTNNCHLMLNSLYISDPSVLLMEPLRSIASLTKLSIEYNDEVAALRYKIISCPNLRSLENYPEVGTSNSCHLMLSDLSISDPLVLLMEPLRSIASLKKLSIWNNDSLVSFPNEAEQWFLNVSSSLSELHFSFLRSLEFLPSSLESLSSLQKLYINGVPMLRELPNLPPNLQLLSISVCHPELKQRYGEEGGSDRHKIARIPHISIY